MEQELKLLQPVHRIRKCRETLNLLSRNWQMHSFIVANLGAEKVFKIDKGHTVSLASTRGSYYLIE